MSPLPLLQNSNVIEQSARLETLSERLTEASVQFVNEASDAPFFLYYAPSLPHLPLTCSRRFRSQSKLGSYGDAVQEIDWSVGQIVHALRDSGREENTLIIFTSDNGPWFEGSAGQLRGRKADTWEGGMRVPFIAAMPSRIPAGRVVNGMANAMDLLPTFANLCQAPLPSAPLHGVDIWEMLVNEVDELEHPVFLYFYSDQLQCGRVGKWKLHVARMSGASWAPAPAAGFMNLPLPKPELYDLENDPGESYDCADENPDIVSYIRERMLERLATFPQSIQRAYAETQSRKVAFTPPGAIPMEQR
jgi:arylsulfatase